MKKKCQCGATVYVRCASRFNRTKYCSKKCQYKYQGRPSGLKYVIKVRNRAWFKKGFKPWNKSLILDEKASNWKGDKVSKDALHDWVENRLGKPQTCQQCGSVKKQIYEWSNINGKYKRDLKDWQRLCKSCHFYYDREKFGARKDFHR